MLHLETMSRSTPASSWHPGPSAKRESRDGVSLVPSQSPHLCLPVSLLLNVSFYVLNSSKELVRWHEGGTERDEDNCLGVTLTVNDSLGLGLRQRLCLHTQTIQTHLEREALERRKESVGTR